jgi:hypothetical protein
LPVNALWLIMGEEPESEASVKTQAEEENRGRMRQVGEPRERQPFFRLASSAHQHPVRLLPA